MPVHTLLTGVPTSATPAAGFQLPSVSLLPVIQRSWPDTVNAAPSISIVISQTGVDGEFDWFAQSWPWPRASLSFW